MNKTSSEMMLLRQKILFVSTAAAQLHQVDCAIDYGADAGRRLPSGGPTSKGTRPSSQSVSFSFPSFCCCLISREPVRLLSRMTRRPCYPVTHNSRQVWALLLFMFSPSALWPFHAAVLHGNGTVNQTQGNKNSFNQSLDRNPIELLR